MGTKILSFWFDFSGKSHPKSTKENPVVDFEECVKLIKEKTFHLVNPKPITLNQNQIAAFSYFFERAIETGLVGQYNYCDSNRLVYSHLIILISLTFSIDPFDGGEITVGDFISKAKEVCATPNVDQPFMCLDLTYISLLLKDGYNLDTKTKVKVRQSVRFMKELKSQRFPVANRNVFSPLLPQLYKKIDDHEISWALGCAYNLLSDVSRTKK